MKKTVVLHTLGCKLNYSETSAITKKFVMNGFSVGKFGEQSDVFFLNSCTVTSHSDKECRKIIRSVLRKNPGTYVIVAGCYSQLKADEISQIRGVDLILGTSEKFDFFKFFKYNDNKEIIIEKFNEPVIKISALENETRIFEAFSSDSDSRTRAFLKIQDGCDYNCAYCTVPLARGRSRSIKTEKVIRNAEEIISYGYKEIVLTGVNVADYYDNEKNFGFFNLLSELNKLEIPRIRISSIEPDLLNTDIILLIKNSDKFCKHFHIPLQSGDDEILNKMKRKYKAENFRNLILEIKNKIPDACIGIDVITGFPGESDKNFENTYEFLNELPFDYLHVFTYSARDNTPAALMQNKINEAAKKQRSSMLRNLSVRKKQLFYDSCVGKVKEVLFESKKQDSYFYGLTSNYIKVRTQPEHGSDSVLENEIKKVILLKSNGIKFIESKLI